MSHKICWKNSFMVMIDDKTRYHVGQQFSGAFYNHPFRAFRMKRRWWGWSVDKEVNTFFYQGEVWYEREDNFDGVRRWDESREDFIKRVTAELKAYEFEHYPIVSRGIYTWMRKTTST